MKYTHFDDITPNNRTEFTMLYFAAMRTMRNLEAAIRKTNNDHLTGRQAGLLLHLQRKLAQMSANYKAPQRKDTCTRPGAKYQTGIVIDLKGPQGNVFYLIGLANKLAQERGLSPEEMAEFKCEQSSATTYQPHLSLLRTWFGIVFVGSDE
ncbi:MAG: hypothetical protein K2M34_04010 [Alphaproteobacteria bacterium]|nr:hypothetical protein [Alphaproteobacteria bacterium]